MWAYRWSYIQEKMALIPCLPVTGPGVRTLLFRRYMGKRGTSTMGKGNMATISLFAGHDKCGFDRCLGFIYGTFDT
jgi:hypothetical protein